MGMGFVAQVQRIPGMTTAAIADVLPGRPKDAFAQAGVNGVVEGDDPGTLSQAVADGRPVGVADARLLVDLPVDVIVDATGVPDVGALISYAALTGGKDVATLNAEADVTIGLLLPGSPRPAGRSTPSARGTSRSRSRSCSTTSTTSASRSSAPARARTTRCGPTTPPTRWPPRPRPST